MGRSNNYHSKIAAVRTGKQLYPCCGSCSTRRFCNQPTTSSQLPCDAEAAGTVDERLRPVTSQLVQQMPPQRQLGTSPAVPVRILVACALHARGPQEAVPQMSASSVQLYDVKATPLAGKSELLSTFKATASVLFVCAETGCCRTYNTSITSQLKPPSWTSDRKEKGNVTRPKVGIVPDPPLNSLRRVGRLPPHLSQGRVGCTTHVHCISYTVSQP